MVHGAKFTVHLVLKELKGFNVVPVWPVDYSPKAAKDNRPKQRGAAEESLGKKGAAVGFLSTLRLSKRERVLRSQKALGSP